MILIWLNFDALTLLQDPCVLHDPHHNNTKEPTYNPSSHSEDVAGPVASTVTVCDAALEIYNCECVSLVAINPGIWTVVIRDPQP